jgi:hypothetical protein
VNRILNQTRALNTQRYANRGAELWFTIKRLVEERLILLPKDDTTLRNQLTNRYFSQSNTNGKILLESKQEARAKGRPSPDRADAVALAFTGLTIHDFLDNISGAQETPNVTKRKVIGNSGVDLEQFMDDLTFKGLQDVRAGVKIHNSLDAAISTTEDKKEFAYGNWN